METTTFFLLLLSIVILFYFFHPRDKTKLQFNNTVSCNINTPSCKMYNNRDIVSKCSSMCKLTGSMYNNIHTFKDNIHTCGCEILETEHFTQEHNDDDHDDRDSIEQQRYNKLNSLIFG